MLLSARQYLNLLDGALVTMQVFIFAALLGSALALLFGVLSLSHNSVVRGLSRVYIEFGRGVSAIILLFFVFFALPILLGIRFLSPMQAGVVALGLNMGAYGSEVVRGGIQSIGAGQTEAAVALNMSPWQRLRYVILPQAVVAMLPPYGNLSIEVLKGTALVSLVTLSDITFEAQKIRTNRIILPDPPSTLLIFATVLVMYFILSQVVARLFRLLERLAGGRWHGARD